MKHRRSGKTRWIGYVWVTVGLFISTGASCPRSRQLTNDPSPVLLHSQSTLEDVIRIVNANGQQVRQLQSSNARLTVPGLPPLEASYAYQSPRNFRLRASTRITGTELDLGSNDQLYWMWVRRSDEPAVYYGRHDQFYQSAAREILPVPPGWIVEALGVVQLDPTGLHEGPIRTRPGQLEIRTRIQTPGGDLTKITVVDDQRGWVLEQHLFDAQQQPLASSVATSFHYDPMHGVSLPRIVDIRLPPAQLNFTLETDDVVLNQPAPSPTQLWTMPQIDGVSYVDLSRAGQAAPAPYQPLSQRSVPVGPDLRVADQRQSAAIRRLPPFDRLR